MFAAEELGLDLAGHVRYEVPGGLNQPSGEDGGFSVAVLPAAEPFRLRGGGGQHVAVDLGPLLVTRAGHRAWIDVTLRAGATIRGSVRYNGRPWRTGQVSFEHADGRLGGFETPDREGRYALQHVPAGRVRLTLRGHEDTAAPPAPVELTVEAGREYVHDFHWTEELVPIRGTVQEANGDPAVSTSVRAQAPGGRWFWTETDAEGSFSVDVLPGALYTVAASRGPVEDARRGVPAGADRVELSLPALGRVRLRLVDASTGAPVELRESRTRGVAWRASGTEAFAAVPNPTAVGGVIELELPLDRPHASIDLALYPNDDGYRPRSVLGLPVTPDGEPTVVVSLERGLSCKLKLVGDEPLTGTPLRGHLLVLLHEEQHAALRGPFPGPGRPGEPPRRRRPPVVGRTRTPVPARRAGPLRRGGPARPTAGALLADLVPRRPRLRAGELRALGGRDDGRAVLALGAGEPARGATLRRRPRGAALPRRGMSGRYPIPAARHRVELFVQRSRFIATADHAPTVAAAKGLLAELRAELPDASHHVHAFVVGFGGTVTLGTSDDGEPAGTAGRPALKVLQNAGLGDVCVVVTRYFGGTKLGTGGLVKAYTEATQLVLSTLPRVARVQRTALRVSLPYDAYDSLKRLCGAYEAEIEGEAFGEAVTVALSVPDDAVAALRRDLGDATRGRAVVEVPGT